MFINIKECISSNLIFLINCLINCDRYFLLSLSQYMLKFK